MRRIDDRQACNMNRNFVPPSTEEIVEILRNHQLIRLRERVKRGFLVGSFAKEHMGIGATHSESDVDILLEIEPNPRKKGMSDVDLEDSYRHALRRYFMKNNIRGKDDSVHPQWCGRRVDLYLTFDADKEARPKLTLPEAQAPADDALNQPVERQKGC